MAGAGAGKAWRERRIWISIAIAETSRRYGTKYAKPWIPARNVIGMNHSDRMGSY